LGEFLCSYNIHLIQGSPRNISIRKNFEEIEGMLDYSGFKLEFTFIPPLSFTSLSIQLCFSNYVYSAVPLTFSLSQFRSLSFSINSVLHFRFFAYIFLYTKPYCFQAFYLFALFIYLSITFLFLCLFVLFSYL